MKTSKKNSRKNQTKRGVIVGVITAIITPFYFVYRIFFALPKVCSPIIGLVRGFTYFMIICWLTSESGNSFERGATEFLSGFMAHSIAAFLVASIGGLCAIMFFVSVLILLGFHMEAEYAGDPRDLYAGAGHPYPNIHRAMKDFDGRLGFGTIHGFATLAKKIMK